jgi:hypothetical protein
MNKKYLVIHDPDSCAKDNIGRLFEIVQDRPLWAQIYKYKPLLCWWWSLAARRGDIQLHIYRTNVDPQELIPYGKRTEYDTLEEFNKWFTEKYFQYLL